MQQDNQPPVMIAAQCCVDVRLQDFQGTVLKKQFGAIYPHASAGGPYAFITDQLERKAFIRSLGRLWGALEKPPTVRIVLVSHEDCKAIGGSGRFGGDLKKEFQQHYTWQMETANDLLRELTTGRHTSEINLVDVEIVHAFLMLSGRLLIDDLRPHSSPFENFDLTVEELTTNEGREVAATATVG